MCAFESVVLGKWGFDGIGELFGRLGVLVFFKKILEQITISRGGASTGGDSP